MKRDKNLPARTPDNTGTAPADPDDESVLPPILDDVQAEVKDRVKTAGKDRNIGEIWVRDHDKYPYTSALYELSYKIGDKVSSLADWFRGNKDPAAKIAAEQKVTTSGKSNNSLRQMAREKSARRPLE
jgi:hypothetical protein